MKNRINQDKVLRKIHSGLEQTRGGGTKTIYKTQQLHIATSQKTTNKNTQQITHEKREDPEEGNDTRTNNQVYNNKLKQFLPCNLK